MIRTMLKTKSGEILIKIKANLFFWSDMESMLLLLVDYAKIKYKFPPREVPGIARGFLVTARKKA